MHLLRCLRDRHLQHCGNDMHSVQQQQHQQQHHHHHHHHHRQQQQQPLPRCRCPSPWQFLCPYWGHSSRFPCPCPCPYPCPCPCPCPKHMCMATVLPALVMVTTHIHIHIRITTRILLLDLFRDLPFRVLRRRIIRLSLVLAHIPVRLWTWWLLPWAMCRPC